MLIVLILGAAWFGYKKAKSSGRNPYLWAVIVVVAFIVPQVLLVSAVALFLAIGIEFWGWRESLFIEYGSLLNIFSLVLGFIGFLAGFRYLDKASVVEIVDQPPPPPAFAAREQDNEQGG